MEVIEQGHEVWKNPDSKESLYKHIELAGRIAYKSEDKITDSSAEMFIKNIIKQGHESVLEHGTHCLDIEYDSIKEKEALLNDILLIKENTVGFNYSHLKWSDKIIVSFNVRTIRDAKRRLSDICLVNDILKRLLLYYPVLYDDVYLGSYHHKQDRIMNVLEYEAGINVDIERIYDKHFYRTVKFITDRGVTHELVRHRPVSYTQESTRYCNYSKKGMTVIKPVFWEKEIDEYKYDTWIDSMSFSEEVYNILIQNNATPQEARSVLPNSLKTEIVCTANIQEWRHILKLRTAKTAHPQMRALMIPLLKEFKEKLPVFFGDNDINYFKNEELK